MATMTSGRADTGHLERVQPIKPSMRLIEVEPRIDRPVEAAARRAFDVAVAGGALVVLSPLLIGIVVASKLTQPGPVLFGHRRIGQHGVTFKCWKFRSMRIDAEEVLAETLASDPELARQWEEAQKLENDPRVTSLGAFLRRFDLDELPQLLNVVMGEMSVVGPRPVVTDELPKFGEHLPAVLSVKPGITGAWQTSGRNSMSYEERVELEADYVRTRGLWRDLVICFRTPLALLKGNLGR